MTPDQEVADAARLAIPAAALFLLASVLAVTRAVILQVGHVRGWLALRRAKASLRRRQHEAWQASGITVVPATVPLDDEDKRLYREAAAE